MVNSWKYYEVELRMICCATVILKARSLREARDKAEDRINEDTTEIKESDWDIDSIIEIKVNK